MNVRVLGCGPAGLLAAHAFKQHGYEVQVVSRKQKSLITGAQYLHEEIPGIDCGESFPMAYLKRGTAAGYAEKVYGDSSHPTSWDLFREGTVPAWSLQHLYDSLWEEWEPSIKDMNVPRGTSRSTKASLSLLSELETLTVSTLPRPHLCSVPILHEFHQTGIKVKQRDPVGVPALGGHITYNGEPGSEWYRMSVINGIMSKEYPSWAAVSGSYWEGVKPISHDCTCWPEIKHLGRFGQWRKGVLVHDSYKGAKELCVALDAAQS